ncbi:hypothetical protein Tco_0581145 [Tanacetum coccineum]
MALGGGPPPRYFTYRSNLSVTVKIGQNQYLAVKISRLGQRQSMFSDEEVLAREGEDEGEEMGDVWRDKDVGLFGEIASFICLIWKINMNKKKFVGLFGEIRLDDCLCVGMKLE